jgi:ubiquinone/menaquinone biosynthesis C-methylase UbiE
MVTSETREFTHKYEEAGFLARKLIDNFFSAVIELVPSSARTIVEVACGAGYSTERLVNAFPGSRIEASDVGPALVELAQQRVPGIPIRVESIYALDRKSSSTDLVVALEVLEHLEDPRAGLLELHRVTSRYAIVSVPREPIWRILNMARLRYLGSLGNTPGHLNHWSTNGFRRFAETAFAVKAVRTPLPWTVLLLEKR